MASEKVSVLIVEDESLVAMDLSMGLEHDGYNVVGIADNADDAMELYKGNEVDIVLMDINIMGDKDGIETAEALMQLRQVPIIYLTAFTDQKTVERVKNTQPAAFLTKPYNISNVRIAIELALNNFAISRQKEAKVVSMSKEESSQTSTPDKELILQMNNFIFVKYNYRFIKLLLSDLLYVEADNNYIYLVTAEKKIAVRLSLNHFLDKISCKNLIRIHRSFAVNIEAIQSFNEQSVMVDKYELPVGRNYRDGFLQQFHFR
jgi:two-component system, response regulator PdtaR